MGHLNKTPMRHGSLFSGIGGFDLASEWMGWDNTFHCEWNPFGQKILKHYWPKSISYEDITKTDFSVHRGTIDILTGGFPCQPYSQAGKRLGTEDDRHLWPEMLRAIREIQPKWVVGENVLGLTNWNEGVVFEEVQIDLENEGYKVQPFILPAASIGAPHRRDRVWFVAYSDSDSRRGTASNGEKEAELLQRRDTRLSEERTSSNSNDSRAMLGVRDNGDRKESNEGRERQPQLESREDSRNVSNTDGKRLEGGVQARVNGEQVGEGTERGQIGEHIYQDRTGVQFKDFPTQSPVCSGDDGVPSKLDGITIPRWKTESIKAYGNAIVPQVVYQIFKAIEEYENICNG